MTLLLVVAACADDVSSATAEESSSSTGDDSNATVTMTSGSPTTVADTSSTGDSMSTSGSESSTDPTDATDTTSSGSSDESSTSTTGDESSSGAESSSGGSSDSSSTGTTAICGNDVIEDAEACDGTDIGADTCVSHGFEGGVIGCLVDCSAFDETPCVSLPACVQEDLDSMVGVPVTSGNTSGEAEVLSQTCAGGGAVDHVLFWVAPSAGFWTFDTIGSGYDTALALYSDCDPSTQLACDDDSGGSFTSRITRYMGPGEAVVISVNGFAGGTGDWVLNISELVLPDNSCCLASDVPLCNDAACAVDVCAADPFCCGGVWHQGCANIAVVFCDVCQEPDVCGNGVLDGMEDCDGIDLGGETCGSMGLGGQLGCSPDDCTFDTSTCVPFGGTCCAPHQQPGCADDTCRDDVCAADSLCCDGFWHQGCSNLANVFCDVCLTPDVCGNNVAEMAETCDGFDVGGQTCVDQGFDGGQLQCLDDCSDIDTGVCFDFEGDCCAAHDGPGCQDDECTDEVCALDPFCCDGFWHPGCAALAIQNCATCFVPDICGNFVIDGMGEACDGADFAGESCQTLGFDGGQLVCAPDCSDYDSSQCADFVGDCCAPHMGIGCDDAECSASVCALDPFCCNNSWDQLCTNEANALCATCFVPDVCGNGVIDGIGEACDFQDFGGATCVTEGFGGGALTCFPDCADFGTFNCTP